MELKEIYGPIAEQLSQVEIQLKKQVSFISEKQTSVKQVINHFFNIPGKRLRPALVLLSANSVSHQASTINHQLIHLSTAVELVHAASLIHDDIIDGAEMRRDQESLNKKFGNQVAVLAGDMVYAGAFSLLSGMPVANNEQRTKILDIFCQITQRMCNGEISEQQITSSKRRITREQYLEMIRDKTACFMSACCQSGAILANSDKKYIQALSGYGFDFGMTYQIIDDYIDKDFLGVVELVLHQAEEFASGAKRSIKVLKNSIYKEKLCDLLDYILSHGNFNNLVVSPYPSTSNEGGYR